MPVSIQFDKKSVEQFCVRHHIEKLAFFGSVLRDDFHKDSDVDVLVEFDPEHVPGLFTLARMEEELAGILGPKVDMRTPHDLSRYFRDEVIKGASIQYAV